MLQTLQRSRTPSGAAYLDRGHGDETVVLIHGVGMRIEAWSPQIERLAEEFRVIAVDLPGHGFSAPLGQPPKLQNFVSWFETLLDELQLGGRELAQTRGQPRRAPRADAAEQAGALLGELDAHASPVLGRAHPLEQTCALEAVDVPRHRRGRNPLLRRQLGQREAGAPFDEPEERRLIAGDPELLGFSAELAGEPEEDGSQVGRDELWAERNGANH